MVDVPYWDHWERISLFEKSFEGTLTFYDLWRQQCEHRPLFPRLIMISLARISQWKMSYEVTTNILISIAMFLTVIFQLKRTERIIGNNRPCWLVLVISLIIFSLAQNECWLWGWTMIIFLNIFAVTAGIIVLVNFGSRWAGFCSAVLLGIIGTYSFASGLIFWIIGLFILLSVKQCDKRNKILKSIIWAAISILIITSYMYSFGTKDNHPSIIFALKNPEKYIGYVLIYLGSPVYSYHPIIAGILGLLGFVFSVYFIRGLIRQRNVEFQIFVPYIALGLYAVGTGLLTGVGRAGFGPANALASRYVTISSLFWICNVAILYFYITTGKTQLQQKIINAPQAITNGTEQTEKLWHLCSREMARQVIAGSILTIVILLVFVNSIVSIPHFKKKYKWLTPARKALLSQKRDPEVLKRLHPNSDRIDAGIDILKKYKLSVFRE
jgi:hypothetical protein